MCTRPITLTRLSKHGTSSQYTVPCGKCAECRAKYQSEFAAQCVLAAKQAGSMWFYTLTYRNDCVPHQRGVDDLTGEEYDCLSLRRKDVQGVLKQFRTNFARANNGARIQFKMVFFGEYGDLTHRPHYHLLVFGLDAKNASALADLWRKKYGFVDYKEIPCINTDGSSGFVAVSKYVSKYVSKRDALPDFVKAGHAELPRKQSSIHLGMDLKPSELECYQNFILAVQSLMNHDSIRLTAGN